MADKATQSDVDSAFNELILATPPDEVAKVEADIAARKNHPLDAQIRWANRVRDVFEQAEVADKYAAPLAVSGGTATKSGNIRPAATNPWSKEGWNVTKQGALVKSIGETKAAAIAAAAGSKIGATKPNEAYA
jgi:hypothetical protein